MLTSLFLGRDRMKLQLNTYAQFLKAPSIRQFSSKINEMDDVINLTIGQPDFQMPDVVKHAYQDAIANDYTTYSHNKGRRDTREAVAHYY